VAMRAW